MTISCAAKTGRETRSEQSNIQELDLGAARTILDDTKSSLISLIFLRKKFRNSLQLFEEESVRGAIVRFSTVFILLNKTFGQ